MSYPQKTFVLSEEAAHQVYKDGTFQRIVQSPYHVIFSFIGQHETLRNTSFFCEKKDENCLKCRKNNQKQFSRKISFVLSISAVGYFWNSHRDSIRSAVRKLYMWNVIIPVKANPIRNCWNPYRDFFRSEHKSPNRNSKSQ